MAKPPIIWNGSDAQLICPGNLYKADGSLVGGLLAPGGAVEWTEDWLSANTGSIGWAAAQAGTSAGAGLIAGSGSIVGTIALAPGTDANSGRASRNTQIVSIIFGGGLITARFNAYLSALSTAAGTEYIAYMGFGDNNTGGEPVDGAYMLYDRATSGDYWVCVTSNNSTRTKTVLDGTGGNPTLAVTSANWFNFRIEADATGANVAFYSSNVLMKNHTTNIPTAAGREFAANFQIYKNGAGVGTGSPQLANDVFYFRKVFTTPRLL